MAHAAVLAVGLLLVRAGWRRRRLDLVLAGVATQVPVAISVLSARPSLPELEASGLGFGLNALLPWLALRGAAMSDLATGAAQPLVVATLVGLALLLSYVPGSLLVVLGGRPRAASLGVALAVVLGSSACAGTSSLASSSTGSVAPPPVVAAPAPIRAPERVVERVDAPALRAVAAPHLGATWDRWFGDLSGGAAGQPSHVEMVNQAGQFQYLVNGQAELIRGMGLNTQYTTFLTPEERAARLDADFAAMAEMGVNTLVGWDPAEFDDVLLEHAAAHGLGVVLPFGLDPDGDYTDPDYRAQLTAQVMARVDQYRGYPALRMWGLGNEVLHKIVHPAWVGAQDPARERQARAFSDWLVQTADAIHAADPDHPVTYRSAEDAFVPWVLDALRRRGGGPRPWFVWGTNCYQDYLSDIVDEWPSLGMGSALWVSEFAPGGEAVPDRPDGFRRMWAYVTRHPDYVLGGAVYAWTRDGPEGVDRDFGLTDDGTPVDGRSIDALTELFHQS
jgi:hypothetical protein